MERRLAVALLLLTPAGACADAGPSLGFSRVPCDHIIEVAADVSAYRFFLVSGPTVVPVSLRTGESYQLGSGTKLTSGHRIALVAVPLSPDKEPTREDVAEMARSGSWPDHVRRWDHFDPRDSVPPYDSRSRVVSRYRLEVAPDGELRLTDLGQNKSSPVLPLLWLACGLSGLALVVWGGLRLVKWCRVWLRDEDTPNP